jgi:hypothetical protein
MRSLSICSVVIISVMLIGCRKPPASNATSVRLGPSQLILTNVTFETIASANGTADVTITFDLINTGTSALPARGYAVDFYVDNNLTMFDHATKEFPPTYLIENSIDTKLAIGLHAYRLLVTSQGLGAGSGKSLMEATGAVNVLKK